MEELNTSTGKGTDGDRSIRVDRVRLEKMMEDRGFTNATLAEAMGVHINTVRQIKTVQSTSFSGLEELCAVLNCHPFDLIVAEGYPEPFSLAPASL